MTSKITSSSNTSNLDAEKMAEIKKNASRESLFEIGLRRAMKDEDDDDDVELVQFGLNKYLGGNTSKIIKNYAGTYIKCDKCKHYTHLPQDYIDLYLNFPAGHHTIVILCDNCKNGVLTIGPDI